MAFKCIHKDAAAHHLPVTHEIINFNSYVLKETFFTSVIFFSQLSALRHYIKSIISSIVEKVKHEPTLIHMFHKKDQPHQLFNVTLKTCVESPGTLNNSRGLFSVLMGRSL